MKAQYILHCRDQQMLNINLRMAPGTVHFCRNRREIDIIGKPSSATQFHGGSLAGRNMQDSWRISVEKRTLFEIDENDMALSTGYCLRLVLNEENPVSQHFAPLAGVIMLQRHAPSNHA